MVVDAGGCCTCSSERIMERMVIRSEGLHRQQPTRIPIQKHVVPATITSKRFSAKVVDRPQLESSGKAAGNKENAEARLACHDIPYKNIEPMFLADPLKSL